MQKVIGFSAFSGTGKTTLIEKLVHRFKQEGLRVAVVKHDAHDFEMDKPGKDSWRFQQAGADITILSSKTKTAMIEQRPRSLRDNLSMVHDVDLVLVEGYKSEPLPRIGLCRKASGKGLPGQPGDYLALATDDESLTGAGVPCFPLYDVEGLAAFIKDHALPLYDVLKDGEK